MFSDTLPMLFLGVKEYGQRVYFVKAEILYITGSNVVSGIIS